MEENNNTSHTVQGSDVYILGQKGKDGREWQLTPDGMFWMYKDEGQDWVVTDIPARGPQGEPLTWEDLTPEQRESLKGEKGDPLTWDDLTPEQKEDLKGDKGDKLTYQDLTAEDIIDLSQNINVNAQRIPAVPVGVLPAGPAGQTRYMEVTAVGAYTYGGTTIGTNADGYQTTFWWNGTTWSNNGSVKIKGDAGASGATISQLFNDSKVGGYAIDEVVRNEVGVEYRSLESNNTYPLYDSTKWAVKEETLYTVNSERQTKGVREIYNFAETPLDRKYINNLGKLTTISSGATDQKHFDFTEVNIGDRLIGTMYGNSAYLCYAFYRQNNENSFVSGIPCNGANLPQTVDVTFREKGYIRIFSRVNQQYPSGAKIIRASTGNILNFKNSLDKYHIHNDIIKKYPTKSIGGNYDVARLSLIKQNLAFNVTRKERESSFGAKDGATQFVSDFGLTHPSVLYIPGGWRGYEFWAVVTPYLFGAGGLGESIENPCITRGNWNSDKTDIIFEEPEGVNPLVNGPYNTSGYWSDCHLLIDDKGLMYAFWRGSNMPSEYLGLSDGVRDQRTIVYKTSIDGVNWSPINHVLRTTDNPTYFGNSNEIISPVINYIDGYWHLYYVAKNAEGIADANNGANQDGFKIVRRIAKTLEEFKQPHVKDDYINFNEKIYPEVANSAVWHFDVKKVGNTYFLIACCTTSTTAFSGGLMTLYYSTDNKNFKKIQNLFGQDCYRPCFVPYESNSESVRFMLFQARAQQEYINLWDLVLNWNNL